MIHDNRDIALGIGADDLGLEFTFIGEPDFNFVDIVDHVIIGEDMALLIEDHPRSHAALGYFVFLGLFAGAAVRGRQLLPEKLAEKIIAEG